MMGSFAARGLGAAARHLFETASRSLLPCQGWRQSLATSQSFSFSSRSRHRQRRQDSDEELEWDEDVDRELPWPNRKAKEQAKKKNKHRRSFKLRCEKFLKPFTLDIFISNRFVHATIMHRALHKVVAVANSNAKEFRGSLPSYGDIRACWVIGKVLSDRAKEADVYTVVYEPRRGEKIDNRMQTILDTLVENDIALELDKS